MTDEQEEQAGAIPAAAAGTATGAVAAEREEAAIAVAPPADASGVAAIDAVGRVPAEVTAAGSAETVAAKAIKTTDAAARDTGVPPQDNARLRDSLEAIKTAVVWLVVLQLLTILSPLLRVSLKWTVIVGLILMLGSFAVGGVAYLKARSVQRGFPE
jgi:hypothetical protein